MKVYLFILIDHSLLSYNGEERLYFTEQEGYNLLKYIHIEKVRRKIDKLNNTNFLYLYESKN